MSFSDLIPFVLLIITGLLALVSVVFVVSGLDDLFIDIAYNVRKIYRKLFVMTKHKPLTEEQLLEPDEQPVAIMIPSWDESPVIRRMIENTLKSVNYSNYHIFVGTYPNDPATGREVELVREQFDNVHRIVCPKDGPTNKADCLNWVYQGIQMFESERNIKFQIYVIHDSEDIIHPLSLKLYNYLVPRKDMIQLPVFPIETGWSNFTAGHYIDEFSENHFKDLVVREFLNKSIPLPCAGVGCAFSRRAFILAREQNRNQLFNIDSLTEDYDFGFRLNELSLEQIFVNHAIERVTTKKSFWTGKQKKTTVKEYIATREFFPPSFIAAVRQKSRWIIGITLQGWKSLGWKGNLWTKYILFRDRKSLVTNQMNFLGYVVVFSVLAVWAVPRLFLDAYRYPPLVRKDTWLWYLILTATFFLVVRLFQQAYFVGHYYGLGQVLLSVPRRVWANIINFAATWRALYLYVKYLRTGKMISWDKTAHVFPSEEELKTYRRRLGDMLLERRFVTVKQLDSALERQKKLNKPLGAILVDMGVVKEDDLIQVLGTQMQLSTREIDPYETPLNLLYFLPRNLAVEYSVYPVDIGEGNTLVVAANNPLGSEQLKALRDELEVPIEVCLSTRGDVSFAIRRGYERLDSPFEVERRDSHLGQILLEKNIISSEQLSSALKEQRRSYRRLGDVLLEEGAVSSTALTEALERFVHATNGHLGDFLVQEKCISERQLKRALELQKSRFRRLGEVMVEMGMISPEKLNAVLEEQSHDS